MHALASLKYKLIDQKLVEKAKGLAAEWKLPETWAVKLGKDGRLIKARFSHEIVRLHCEVTGPGKDLYTKDRQLESFLFQIKVRNKKKRKETKRN